MKASCRDMGTEDLVPGARFCAECFRYKTKEHECRDFRFGGARLVKQVESAKGKKRWQVKREKQ